MAKNNFYILASERGQSSLLRHIALFGLSLNHLQYFVYASSEGSSKTVLMHSLAGVLTSC